MRRQPIQVFALGQPCPISRRANGPLTGSGHYSCCRPTAVIAPAAANIGSRLTGAVRIRETYGCNLQEKSLKGVRSPCWRPPRSKPSMTTHQTSRQNPDERGQPGIRPAGSPS